LFMHRTTGILLGSGVQALGCTDALISRDSKLTAVSPTVVFRTPAFIGRQGRRINQGFRRL
jgi:hypothetical protein